MDPGNQLDGLVGEVACQQAGEFTLLLETHMVEGDN